MIMKWSFMSDSLKAGLGVFANHISLWVTLCIALGVPAFLSKFEYAKVSTPVAVLIWLMIFIMYLIAALATVVSVLTVVSVMLSLVKIARATRLKFLMAIPSAPESRQRPSRAEWL